MTMDIKDFQVPRLGRAQLDSPLDPSTAFIDDGATVAYDSDAAKLAEYVRKGKTIPAFELAGPRARIYHDPSWCKAAVLTAGGLCPGLNDVIKFLRAREIVHFQRFGEAKRTRWRATKELLT